MQRAGLFRTKAAVTALDYLLKPVEKGRLAETVDRARRIIQDRKGADAAPPKSPVLAARTKLLVRAANRNFIVDANDLIYATIDSGLFGTNSMLSGCWSPAGRPIGFIQPYGSRNRSVCSAKSSASRFQRSLKLVNKYPD